MRTIIATLLILSLAGWLATRMPAGTPPFAGHGATRLDDGWRRTAQGWERRTQWALSNRTDQSTASFKLHPALLAAFQILVSLFAWVVSIPSAPAHRNTDTLRANSQQRPKNRNRRAVMVPQRDNRTSFDFRQPVQVPPNRVMQHGNAVDREVPQ